MWFIWRPIFNWKNLCPVVFADPTGFLLVMRRAEQPVSFVDIAEANKAYDYYPDIDVEYKPENWGKLDGKLVCLDYGIAGGEFVVERRKYLESKSRNFSNT